MDKEISGSPTVPTIAGKAEFEQWLLHFLLEQIPDRIYFKDRESRFLKISRAMAEFFSIADPEDAVGKTDFDFFTPEHARPAYEDERRMMTTGEPIVGKVEKETLPDGRVGWAITTKMPLRDPSGRILGTCGISKDFTAQKALEESLQRSNEQLAQREKELRSALEDLRAANEKLKATQKYLVEAEKVESLGRLAFGLAHEIRNPLNTLNMAVEYLSADADEKKAPVIQTMRAAIAHADSVIRALMDASAASNLQLEECNVIEVIEAALTAHEPVFQAAGITAETKFDEAVPATRLDRARFQEVLAALFQNSVDAMPEGGKLTVTVGKRKISQADVDRNEGLRSGQRARMGDWVVSVEIADEGTGIPKENLGNVFDPFFTTRSTGRALGLGLTVCRKIVDLHGGTITAASSEAGGTRMTILLPIAPNDPINTPD